MKSTSPGLPLAIFLASSATRSFLQNSTQGEGRGVGGARDVACLSSLRAWGRSCVSTSKQTRTNKEAGRLFYAFAATRGVFFRFG